MELFKKQSQESCSQIFVVAHVVYFKVKEDSRPSLGTTVTYPLLKSVLKMIFPFPVLVGYVIVPWRVGFIHDRVGLGVRGFLDVPGS